MELSSKQANELIIELIIDLNIQLRAMKDLMMTEYCGQTGEDSKEISLAYSQQYKVRRLELMNEIRKKFEGFDVDDLLNRLVPPE